MAGSRTLKLSILADIDNLKKNLDAGSNEVEGFGGKLEKFSKVAAAAFAAAAAAAAAYAGKLAIEGVKAAIEDEAAQQRLASALQNVTGATEAQIAAIEDQILKTSLATGVADEQLRPALQRLATATGSLDESQKLLNLALDISAGTGKDVEAVSNALAKAYEGNTSSLERLGIGLDKGEVKTKGLEAAVASLTDLYGGAAAEKANTFEGQIARLKIGFDEAKESVGAALLPALRDLLDYFTNNLIPKLIEAKNKAIDPIKRAFEDNRETLQDLWKFIKDYIVPIFEFVLVNAIKNAGAAIAGIVNIIAKVFDGVRTVVDNAIDGINAFIRAYNAIPILPDIQLISKPAWVTGSNTGSIGNFQMSTGTTLGGATPEFLAKMAERERLGITGSGSTSSNTGYTMSVPTGISSAFTSIAGSTFDPSNFRTGENAGITINVNSPSIIDEEGFARAVVTALNNSTNRGTTGAGDLRTSAQIL
jgi:hypothetical protein